MRPPRNRQGDFSRTQASLLAQAFL